MVLENTPQQNAQVEELLNAEYPTTVSEIDITNYRLSVVPPQLGAYENVQKLVLRQNRLSTFPTQPPLHFPHLTALDLFENSFTSIQPLCHLTQLLELDMSFNSVRDLSGLEQLSGLKSLYLANNRIHHIKHLPIPNTTLKVLEMGSNQLREISEEVNELKELEELWLGRNKITAIPQLRLSKLKKISLQSNRIVHINNDCFMHLTALRELYLSHNGIEVLPTFLPHTLQTLDISNNRIQSIGAVAQCGSLVELWMNDNRLDDWTHVEEILGALPHLETVYLERNPIHRTYVDSHEEQQYTQRVRRTCAKLKQLDAEVF